MSAPNTEAIRRALAERLAGMRERCGGKHAPPHGPECIRCHGKHQDETPIPLDDGEISVGRLIRAIEAEGLSIDYHGDTERWEVYADADTALSLATDPDLAVAYLKAVEAWPLKEDAHA